MNGIKYYHATDFFIPCQNSAGIYGSDHKGVAALLIGFATIW